MEFKQEGSPKETDLVWPKYGLKESPYSTSPMRILGILPIQKVFSGRTEEVSLLKKLIRSKGSTRNLIVGDFGVGKTTFVNYVRWNLCLKHEESKYLTTSAEIKFQPNCDAISFLMSTLSAIYTSSLIFDWGSKGIKINALSKLKDYVSINKQTNIQGTIAGFGGGYGQSQTNPPTISPEILENLLQDFCKELLEKGLQIIIPYDNLENIENEKLSDFFRSIRDYLQIDGLHTIFLGPPSAISALESYGQVHSVFDKPIILKPLTEKNILEILSKRCDALKIEDGKYISPYDVGTVKAIYSKLSYNIRFTFKVLEDATINSETKAPCEITMRDILAIQEKEKIEIMSSLTDTQLKIVSALLEYHQLSQKRLSAITKIGITNLVTPVRELENRGLITIKKDDKDKRIKYVKISENSYLKLSFNSERIQ